MERINIKAHNYKLSEKQDRQIKNKMELLLKQAPIDSRFFLDFSYNSKIFSGKLRVDFNGKSFFAKSEGLLLPSLTGDLCKKAQKQVMKWKKSRTAEEITGIISLQPLSASPPPLYLYKKSG